MKERILEKLKKIKKLHNFNLIQFVPVLFMISLVGNSVLGYTEPKSAKTSVSQIQDVKAETKEEKEGQKAAMGELDLTKIKDGTYEGTGTGFRGKIKVAVTVKSHKITAVKVLSKSDDAAYFNRASAGIIKSVIDSQSLNVDVVSGATYSSKGILAAIKNALTGEEDNSKAAATDGAGGSGTAKKLGTVKETGEYKDGTYTGTGQGFRGTIKVSVTIKNGKIAAIKVLSKSDDAAYFGKAKSGVIAAILKGQTTNVDVISGATYSSNGIIQAVRNALKKAAVEKSDKKEAEEDDKKDEDSNLTTLSGEYKNGTYTGSGQGFRGKIRATVKIKKNRMTSITLKNEKDDESFFHRAASLVQSVLKKQDFQVDVISGATYSSNGIKEAVKTALEKAEIKEDSEDDTKPSEDESEKPDEPSEDETTAVYTGNAICKPDGDRDFSEYNLSLEIIVSGGKVTEIQNVKGSGKDYLSINDDFINMAKNKIIPKLLNGTPSSQCDAVSGATCSSKAILEAYDQAVSKIEK
ncbi:MAG: FMN-binding protein [Anaerostipes sp.]|nr:FMN-binding protein [Anaerostipes sp.]